jgi:NAD(P)H-nitrite reductase large subunit
MLGLETVQDVRQFTSAGNGCTACHAELQKLLLRQQAYSASSSPICSVK